MHFEDHRAALPSEYWDRFKLALAKYWKTAVVPAALVLIGAVGAAVFVDDYYTAEARFIIRPPLLTSPVISKPTDEEVEAKTNAIMQTMLARNKIRGIITKFDLYPGYSGAERLERAYKEFVSDVTVEPLVSPTGMILDNTFRVAYTHQDPRIAAKVIDLLSEFVVAETLNYRSRQVSGTTEFLSAQLEEVRKKLQVTEERVRSYVESNFGKLPEHLEQASARLQNIEARLSSNTQLIAAHSQRASFLREELSRAGSSPAAVAAAPSGADTIEDPYARLDQLQRTLAVLLSRYTERHPDVQTVKSRIASLEKQLGAGGAKSGTPSLVIPSGGNAVSSGIRRELNEVNVELARLEEENKDLRVRAEELQNDIEKMPLKEQELKDIQRDYVNVKENYERLLAARQDAELQSDLLKTGNDLEFKVYDRSGAPQIPSGPNRLLISAIGVGGALALFFGLPILLFLLNSSFKYRAELEQETNVPVLESFPLIALPIERRPQRLLLPMGAAGVVLLLLMAAAIQESDVLLTHVARMIYGFFAGLGW